MNDFDRAGEDLDNGGRCVVTVYFEDFPEVCDNERPCPAHDLLTTEQLGDPAWYVAKVAE